MTLAIDKEQAEILRSYRTFAALLVSSWAWPLHLRWGIEVLNDEDGYFRRKILYRHLCKHSTYTLQTVLTFLPFHVNVNF